MQDTFRNRPTKILAGINPVLLVAALLFQPGLSAEDAAQAPAIIQELENEVARLKEKIKSLENENDVLRAKAQGSDLIKVKAQVQELVKSLRGNRTDRFKARQELCKIGRPAVPALIEGVRSSHPFVTQTSIQTLGDIGDTSAIPALLEVLAGPNTDLAADSNRALGKITRQYFGIIGLDESADERKEVIEKWQAWWKENEGK
ncbi:MAG: HEAT repeat domain-containing protein [Planctomycetota bacterium]|nr:HEAT repeat domain-containing protein [Planctomycetota bacterium]MDA1137468.1 HEAT repeat domain-containing protein [Planctomycetota bacterium]